MLEFCLPEVVQTMDFLHLNNKESVMYEVIRKCHLFFVLFCAINMQSNFSAIDFFFEI